MYLGKTPLYLEMEPGLWYVQVRAEKEGYQSATIILPKKNDLPYKFELKKK